MLYDSYVNRIKKVKVIRNFIIKYKLPIIILLAVIVLTISALVGTRGIVTDVELSSEGQEIVLNDDGSPESSETYYFEVNDKLELKLVKTEVNSSVIDVD